MSCLHTHQLGRFLQAERHPVTSVLHAWLKQKSAEHKSQNPQPHSSSSAASLKACGASNPKPTAAAKTEPPPGYESQLLMALNSLYPVLLSKSLREKLVNPDNGFAITPFLSADQPGADPCDFVQGFRDGLEFMGNLVRQVQLPKTSRYVPYTTTADGGLSSHMFTDVLWDDLIRFLHASTSRSHLDGVLMSFRITRFDIQQQGFDLPLRRVLHDSKARNSGLMGKLILRMKTTESNKLMVLAACQIIGNMFTNHLSGVFASKQADNLAMHEAWILYVMNLDGAIFYRNGVPKHLDDVQTTVEAQTLAYHQPKKQRTFALKQALNDPKSFTTSPPPPYQ